MRSDLVGWAETEARRRLSRVGQRWRHSAAVAQQAEAVAFAVESADRRILVAAAFMHDVGYAHELAASGFHPLDGARWLEAQGHPRLAGLVAHHTGAAFEAVELGLGMEVAAFMDEGSAVSDALTYSDLTTGPAGNRTTVAERFAEIEDRYGPSSVVVRALHAASESLFAMVERTEHRLAQAGVRQPVA